MKPTLHLFADHFDMVNGLDATSSLDTCWHPGQAIYHMAGREYQKAVQSPAFAALLARGDAEAIRGHAYAAPLVRP